MGESRTEDILQAIIDGESSETLPDPQSRVEALLTELYSYMGSGSVAVEETIAAAEAAQAAAEEASSRNYGITVSGTTLQITDPTE